MQGNPKVIDGFMKALTFESQLNMQYRFDWHQLKFLGAKKTAKHFKKFGDDAHDWMKAVTNQLLFLSGTKALGSYDVGKVVEADGLTAVFADALRREVMICDAYERNIPIAMEALDDMSRNLWEHLIKWHRGHQLWLERELNLITVLTETGYLQEKL
jgi:bacterioferritin (cytochrome b1)